MALLQRLLLVLPVGTVVDGVLETVRGVSGVVSEEGGLMLWEIFLVYCCRCKHVFVIEEISWLERNCPECNHELKRINGHFTTEEA